MRRGVLILNFLVTFDSSFTLHVPSNSSKVDTRDYLYSYAYWCTLLV